MITDLAPATLGAFRNGAPGVYRGIPAAEYHKLVAVSSSILKRIHTHSEKHAKAWLDDPTLISGEAIDVGDGAHCLTLTPEQFESSFVLAEQCTANKADGFSCTNGGTMLTVEYGWRCGVHSKKLTPSMDGRTLLTLDNYRRVKGVRDSVWANPDARAILEAATDFELSLLWIDDETGLLNKARLDIFCGRHGILPDLKTCRSLKFFEKDAWDRGYQIQLAHYRRGAIACDLPAEIPSIIAIESDEPFDSAVFEASASFMEYGVRDMQAAQRRLADAMATGVWPGIFQSAQYLNPPAWAK